VGRILHLWFFQEGSMYPKTLYHDTEGSCVVNSYEEESALLENHWTVKPTLAALSQRVDALESRLDAIEKPKVAKGKV
jgi:hypothetical protein